MKRETLINVLLIIAGIVLAIALFGAGVFWKAKSSPKLSGQLTFDADYRERSSDKRSTARYLLGQSQASLPICPRYRANIDQLADLRSILPARLPAAVRQGSVCLGFLSLSIEHFGNSQPETRNQNLSSIP